MSFQVLLRPEAEAEIGDAATWYEEQKPGLGREFIEAIFQRSMGYPSTPCLPLPVTGVETSDGFFQAGFPIASSTRWQMKLFWLFACSTQPGTTDIGARDCQATVFNRGNCPPGSGAR